MYTVTLRPTPGTSRGHRPVLYEQAGRLLAEMTSGDHAELGGLLADPVASRAVRDWLEERGLSRGARHVLRAVAVAAE